ncbi:MAG: DUF1194 domain-containing protein [Nitrosopumilaceae archaeon]
MIEKKTFTMFALMAILLGSIAPSTAFAITPEEEMEQSRFNTVSSAADLPVNVVGPKQGPVDLELQLLMDVSGSVDDTEFLLQRTGYSDAFRDAETLSRILGCGDGKIAAQLIYWSGGAQQVIAVDWTEISDATTADAFADAIDLAARPAFGGGALTAPGSAINFGYPLIFSNLFTSPRQVIDVSGDGAENDGDDTPTARDAALAAGVEVINGVVILGEPGLEAFYTASVIGGTGAFLETAATFDDFGDAIKAKLGREICNPVGGELLDINTTSLFVAGLSANAIWIIPVIAGLAGTGIYFIRSRTDSEEI